MRVYASIQIRRIAPLACSIPIRAQNAELYGKCNNPYGHGHDYILHLSVQGEPDPVTGRVVDLGALDRYVPDNVL